MSNPAEDQPVSGAPLSRRAAREAAERNAPAVDAGTGSETEIPQPAVAPARDIVDDGVMTPAPDGRATDDSGTEDKALTDMSDLFAAAPDAGIVKKQTRRKRRKGCLVWLIVLVILAGGLTAAGITVNNVWGETIREKLGMGEPKDYDSSQTPGEKVTVVIASGDTGVSISTTLYEAGVTKTAAALSAYLRESAQNPDFFPGTYSIQSKLPAKTALAQLQDPANKLENTALIREGLTAIQIFPILAEALQVPEADVLAAAKDPQKYGVNAVSLEGWLFPATYTFEPGTTPEQAITTLVDRTRQSLKAAGVPAEREEEILNIASIVQREGHLDDFGKVSRVIYNRLATSNNETHGFLQMDSTAQYAQDEMDSGVVFTSEKALTDVNEWNTYTKAGLPLTPIASPGDAAIDAAMHPDEGPWLYFVTWNQDTGETIFSVTNAEHEEAKKKMFAWCDENPDNKACGN